MEQLQTLIDGLIGQLDIPVKRSTISEDREFRNITMALALPFTEEGEQKSRLLSETLEGMGWHGKFIRYIAQFREPTVPEYIVLLMIGVDEELHPVA